MVRRHDELWSPAARPAMRGIVRWIARPLGRRVCAQTFVRHIAVALLLLLAPALALTATGEARATTVARGSGGAPGSGGDCAAPPPPQAVAAGYTTLLFCDDFSTPASIDMDAAGCPNRGPCAAAPRVGYKWFRAGKPFNYPETPREDITVRDGVLTLDSKSPNPQLITTYWREGGGFGGFSVKNKGAYFEAAVSFPVPPESWLAANKASFIPGRKAAQWRESWPSFWSMDTCHLYGRCSPYMELDFFEYLSYSFAGPDSYSGALHRWLDLTLLNKPCGSSGGLPQCHQKEQSNNWSVFKTGFLGDRGVRQNNIIRVPAGTDWSGRFNVVGTLLKHGEGVYFFFNDVAYTANTYAEFPWLSIAEQGDYPVILGSRDWPMRVDWVRVWGKPPS
jgi:hypothetical protein